MVAVPIILPRRSFRAALLPARGAQQSGTGPARPLCPAPPSTCPTNDACIAELITLTPLALAPRVLHSVPVFRIIIILTAVLATVQNCLA